ncbi:uncharacterized protein YxeA [Metabacillus crassostreae]|nr:uncharacterized protein YxeA [Metabacillus crassostreae]
MIHSMKKRSGTKETSIKGSFVEAWEEVQVEELPEEVKKD